LLVFSFQSSFVIGVEGCRSGPTARHIPAQAESLGYGTKGIAGLKARHINQPYDFEIFFKSNAINSLRLFFANPPANPHVKSRNPQTTEIKPDMDESEFTSISYNGNREQNKAPACRGFHL
jgi:hypothetical protein